MWYFLLKIYAYFAPNYKPVMKAILSERNIVVVLFVMVLITFSLAQEDSKKMEQLYSGSRVSSASQQLAEQSATFKTEAGTMKTKMSFIPE